MHVQPMMQIAKTVRFRSYLDFALYVCMYVLKTGHACLVPPDLDDTVTQTTHGDRRPSALYRRARADDTAHYFDSVLQSLQASTPSSHTRRESVHASTHSPTIAQRSTSSLAHSATGRAARLGGSPPPGTWRTRSSPAGSTPKAEAAPRARAATSPS